MRIALFGCGRIAQTHAKLLNALTSDAQLIFCDRNLDRAEKYSAQFSSKAPAYSDLAIMLEAESPTAVHILTHPESHFGTATIALEAGAHTYIEKPVTESLDELLSLQELAASRQRILYAGYSTLGYPVVQRAKRLIESGKMGDLVSMHSTFNFAPPTGQIPYGNPEHWAYSLDGGILQNVIDHPLSLLADALDDATVRHVRVLRRADLPQRSPNLMHVSAGNDRQIGSFTLSYANGNASAAVSYYLEAGTIDVDLRSFTLTTQYGTGPQSLVKRVFQQPEELQGEGFALVFPSFAIRRLWHGPGNLTDVFVLMKVAHERAVAEVDCLFLAQPAAKFDNGPMGFARQRRVIHKGEDVGPGGEDVL